MAVWSGSCRSHLASRLLRTKLFSSQLNEFCILGIETSCDDTGASVVSSTGRVLSNEKESQVKTHLKTGGIIPIVAQQLHQENIESVVDSAIHNSGTSISDIKAIAVTLGPGMPLSLHVGVEYAIKLSKQFKKPLIPIHHMEAHGLTARIMYPIKFPFLVLLVSGGHCILAVCEGIGKWYRLGQTLDSSPGEAFDKVARMLRLNYHPLGAGLSGGAAIEAVAQLGNPLIHPLPNIMLDRLNCNFSFSGIKTAVSRLIDKLDVHRDSSELVTESERVSEQKPVLECENIAASFQITACSHLLNRTHRAMVYCKHKWPSISQLVVSGGVASNLFLREQLSNLTNIYGYDLYAPPIELCTDNGVMIAWTGVEHIKAGNPIEIVDSLYYRPRWGLGTDISETVGSLKIKNFKL